MSGASIRTVAKAAVVGGYRSAAAVRRAVLPPSSASADSRRATSTTCSSDDDWVIPDREVFGPVPTFEEAMAATFDLRDAFEIVKVGSHAPVLDISKASLSPSELEGPTKVALDAAIPNLVCSETSQDLLYSEASKLEDSYEKSLVSSGASVRVVEAFSMLNEIPGAQDVVASLASDKNVWDAVLNNEKVMQFYKKNLSGSSSISVDEVQDSDVESVQSSSGLSPSTGEALRDYVERMKALVSEMVTNLSSIMQDLIATSSEGQAKGKLKTLVTNSNNFANPASTFVLLAIASIMVVLLKRA